MTFAILDRGKNIYFKNSTNKKQGFKLPVYKSCNLYTAISVKYVFQTSMTVIITVYCIRYSHSKTNIPKTLYWSPHEYRFQPQIEACTKI